MVLPLYAALEKLDQTLLEAAADLGCPPTAAFWKITFPLSLPGVIAGCFLVFIPVDRRVRHPRPARRLGHADDRQDPVDRVLQQPRLAARLGRRGHPAPAPGRADRALPAPAQAQRQERGARHEPPSLRCFNIVSIDARLCLPLSADRPPRHLLVQRLQAGHGLGRLLDQMVRRALLRTRRSSMPPG